MDSSERKTEEAHVRLAELAIPLGQAVAKALCADWVEEKQGWRGKIDDKSADLVIGYLGLKLSSMEAGLVRLDMSLSRRWVPIETTLERAEALIAKMGAPPTLFCLKCGEILPDVGDAYGCTRCTWPQKDTVAVVGKGTKHDD